MTRVQKRKGQALVLVTLALFAMCGLMGLAIDMGWSFYIEKTSQAAADSAAMSTVLEVLKLGGKLGPYTPGINRTNTAGAEVVLNAPSTMRHTCGDLPSTSSGSFFHEEIACLYAAKNGFGNAVNTATNVDVTWGDTSPPPEVPDVDPVYYWATAYVAQSVPQLFSAILGNTQGLVASKATAAIVDSVVTGSLILLNRENDCVPMETGQLCANQGTNLLVQANANCPPGQNCADPYSLRVGGGVIAASAANGVDYPQDDIALVALGGSQVEAQYYAIRSTGTYYEDNNANFGPQKPQNGFSGSMFEDPTEGLPNPPLPNPANLSVSSLGFRQDGVIPGGSDAASATPLLPGIYAATGTQGGNTVLTASPTRLTGGYYKFVDSSGVGQTGFSDYVFLGGLHVASGAHVSLAPGRYVMMGAEAQGGNPGEVLSIASNSVIDDGLTFNTAAPEGNPGQLWVLAGPDYDSPNGYTVDQFVARVAGQYSLGTATAQQLGINHGTANIQLGNNETALVNLHGLNPSHTTALDVDGDLNAYRRFLMWQDRDNSVVAYDSTGHVLLDSVACNGCADPLAYPLGTNTDPDAVGLTIQASPGAHLYGVVYQPRGAFTAMVGGGGYSGPLQIVTGAFKVQGNATLDLGVLDFPLVTRIVTLIQ